MPSARDHGATRAETPATPSRRAVLAGSTAALLAGAAAVTAARGAPVAAPGGAGDDAEMVRLCDRLVAIEAEEAAIFATVPEDEQDTVLLPFTEEFRQIENRLYDLGDPTTPEGLRAAARAALAHAPRDMGGNIDTTHGGIAEWLAFGIAETLAAGSVAA
jgi:hypothetical protein